MPEDWRSIARKYRRQAEHLRYVVELIEDARLREQLLSITRQHDAAAGSIEQELRLQAVGGEAVRMQPNLRTPATWRCGEPRRPSHRIRAQRSQDALGAQGPKRTCSRCRTAERK